ncbi:hypothetical protein AB0N24_00580 [Arthrobacter sp. NPDC093128]|uniref:hypothetical protein n=1 Tax=Arthrobacter sp. NPDC093128 TaxID=3154979 RepID=UPI0034339371
MRTARCTAMVTRNAPISRVSLRARTGTSFTATDTVAATNRAAVRAVASRTMPAAAAAASPSAAAETRVLRRTPP